MRLFIAVELPEEIKHLISRLQEKLKTSQSLHATWVKPQNIHLTLKFLGETDEKKLDKIKQAMQKSVKNQAPFSAGISACGAFPKLGLPRIIWVGVGYGDAQLKQIFAGLENNLAEIGIAKEDRPFASHITIARVRSGLNRDNLIKILNDTEGDFQKRNCEFTVAKITLFKSTLKSTGPIYEILYESNFTAT